MEQRGRWVEKKVSNPSKGGRARIQFVMKSDKFGCQRLHEIARGALKAWAFEHVGESEGVERRIGKLLERR